MSWHFSQALVEEYLEGNCLDGERFAPSSANQAPPQCYSTDRTLATSRHSPFGMTCAPLTDDRGEELLTWYLADFPVRTSASQETQPDSTANALDSGVSSPASFAKWDRVSCGWKTHQLSLLGGLTPYSETWPRWGTMRNGESSERMTPELGTSENGSGLLPTPTTQDSENNGGPSQRERNTPPLNAIVDGLLNPDWVEWLMGWPIGWTDLDNDDPGFHDWQSEPPHVPRTTDRRHRRPARLKAIGNGQVPQAMALAWTTLNGEDPHVDPR